MNLFPSKKFVDTVKMNYPKGTRICFDRMGDDPNPIESGSKGTVICVDDVGTIHVNFDNGRCLGLIPEEDSFHKIAQEDGGDSK